jgi:hypothetical protein
MTSNTALTDTQHAFITTQHLFFVATAGQEGRVNVSPKGLDSLRVISPTRIVWLSLSGSGNETAAHVLHPRDAAWPELLQLFPEMAGARQIFDLSIKSVSLSCGTGVPLMDFKAERGPTEMLPFYAEMPPGGIEAYWARKNRLSIDGKPTGIFENPDENTKAENH